MAIKVARGSNVVSAPAQRISLARRYLYVPVPATSDVNYVDKLVHDLPYGELRAADDVVLRLHPATSTALLSHPERTQILADIEHRAAGAAVSLLTFNGGAPRFYCHKQLSWVTDAELARALCHADLWSLLQQPGCVLAPTPEFHFEGPNRSHFKGFVRPGLALLSTESLDSAAFWLLPHYSPGMAIVADTGHLLGLAMHIQRYYSEQLGQPFQSAPCDAVRGYQEHDTELHVRLSRLHERASKEELLILVSARSSGRLEARLIDQATSLWPTVAAVSMFGIAEDGTQPPPNVLCTLPPEYERLGQAPCELCRQGVPLVRVDPHTYLLEVSAAAQRSTIGLQDAARAKEFLERYRGRGVVSLHRTRSNPGEESRHHMVHLNTDRLIQLPEFQARLERQAEELRGRFDAVLAPSHHAARALAERVAALSGTAIVICDEEGLRAQDVEALKRSASILIVDDVVTSGTRLRGYKKRLRECDWFDPGKPLHMLVAVARPTSDAQLALVRDMLKPHGVLASVEQLSLPDWDDKECPWCREARRLAAVSVGQSEYFSRRSAMLRDTDAGIDGEAFLRLDGSGVQMSLTDSPVFGGGLTQVELFLAVASAVQEVRNRGKLLEYAQPPVAKVLSPDGYLTGRYFEAIIDAAICRAARRFDLRTSTIEPELIAKVGRRLDENISRELRAELLMAIAEGRLPPPLEMGGAVAAAAAPEADVWAQLLGLPRNG